MSTKTPAPANTSRRRPVMETAPDTAEFRRRYEAGEPQVVSTKLVADLETPVSAYLKLAAGKPMSFLLESVEGGASRGRWQTMVRSALPSRQPRSSANCTTRTSSSRLSIPL